MATSKLLKQFQSALEADDDKKCQTLLDAHPSIAHQVEMKNDKIVTALDMAMMAGKPALCEQLLQMGARIDVPIGSPPTDRNPGITAMSRVFTLGFMAVENSDQVRDVLVSHFAKQQNLPPAPSRLSVQALDNQADNLMTALNRETEIILKNSLFLMTPAQAQSASLDAIMGIGLDPSLLGPTVVMDIGAARAAEKMAGLVNNKNIPFAQRHAQMQQIFKHLAAAKPKPKKRRSNSIDSEGSENDENHASTDITKMNPAQAPNNSYRDFFALFEDNNETAHPIKIKPSL